MVVKITGIGFIDSYFFPPFFILENMMGQLWNVEHPTTMSPNHNQEC